MNACVVEGYEIPVGSRVYIAQTTPITWTTSSQTPSHSILTAICLHAMSTAIPVCAVWAGHAHVSGIAMDGTATGCQCVDDRALLYARGGPCELQASVQSTSVDKTEQEAEVSHRRTEAPTARLTHHFGIPHFNNSYLDLLSPLIPARPSRFPTPDKIACNTDGTSLWDRRPDTA